MTATEPRPDDITEQDWKILGALDDEWRYLTQIDVYYARPFLAGRLNSLRRRGLVSYRPPDHDVHPRGEWALTGKGMRLVWGHDPAPTNPRVWR